MQCGCSILGTLVLRVRVSLLSVPPSRVPKAPSSTSQLLHQGPCEEKVDLLENFLIPKSLDALWALFSWQTAVRNVLFVPSIGLGASHQLPETKTHGADVPVSCQHIRQMQCKVLSWKKETRSLADVDSSTYTWTLGICLSLAFLCF